MFFIKALDNGEFIVKVHGDDSQFETSYEEQRDPLFVDQLVDFINKVIEKDK